MSCPGRIDAPPNTRQFRKNRKNKIKCAGTASSCDFLREKVRNSSETWDKSVKNYPFSAGNTQNGGGWGKKVEILVFLGVLGPFRPPNSAKLFFGPAPLQRPKGEKKVRQWVQTSAKPRFIEIEIEKNRCLIEIFLTPNYPEICYAVQGSGGAH